MVEKPASPEKVLTVNPDGSNIETVRKMAQDIVDAVIEHFSTLNAKGVYRESEIESSGGSSCSWDGAVDYIRTVMSGSMQVAHPRFFGHMDSGPLFVSVLSDWVASALNQNMLNPELSPVASRIDYDLIRWLLTSIGCSDGEGALVSGGTMSNFTALLLSLHHVSKGRFRQEGFYSLSRRPVVFSSSEAHYSVSKIASAAGIGEQGLIKVPTDKQFRMDAGILEQEIVKAENLGKLPLMVVATAGTTSTGNVDPIFEVAKICREHGVWLHVDAAHGGGALFSPRVRVAFSGIENADSVTIDPHKWLMQPKSIGVILTRHKGMLNDLFGHEAPYLHGDISKAIPNWGSMGFQGSRRFDSLKLWVTRLYLGDNGLAGIIDKSIELVSEWKLMLSESEGFEIAHEPDLNILCFRYKPKGLDENEVDFLNDSIQKEVMKSGKGYVSSTTLRNHRWLRSVFINPTTTLNDLRAVREEIERVAKSLTC
ncbi:MAG: pyridoxal phosphate-dependent decarboxylase family protein [Thermoplasmataceae archaeon]